MQSAPGGASISPRILFLIRSLEYGGAERQLVTLAVGLRSRGVDVHVAVFYSETPLDGDLRAAGIPIHELHKKGRWDFVHFTRTLAALIRHVRPDVLYTYQPAENVAGAFLRKLGMRVVLIWGVQSSFIDLHRYDRLTALTFHLERRFSRVPDLIIANSYAGKATRLEEGFPPEKTAVVWNAIDVERYRRDEEDRRRVRREWGFGDDEIVIGIVARLDPMKGHESFIAAAELLTRNDPRLRFVAVGGDRDNRLPRLQKMTAELEAQHRWVWAGNRPDMPSVYSALDILCVPSLFGEGFPNVIGEAMACGVPAVATHVGDAAEIVGELGVIVPPGDVVSLARGLRSLVEHRADPETLRAHVKEHFTMSRLLDETMSLIESQVRAHQKSRP